MKKNNDNYPSDEEYKKIMDDYAESERQFYKEQVRLKADWKEKLKDLIPKYDVLMEWLSDGLDDWTPIGIVEVYEVEEKASGYSNYQHVRIKDDEEKLLYMKNEDEGDEEEIGVNHHHVWQMTGYLGDDYSGFMLFPMTDGRYFKVSYNC